MQSCRAAFMPDVQVVPVNGSELQDGRGCGFFAVQTLDVALKHVCDPNADVDFPAASFRRAYDTDHRGADQIPRFKAELVRLMIQYLPGFVVA